MNLKNKLLAFVLTLGLISGSGIKSEAIDGTPFAEETITVSSTSLGITSGLCAIRSAATGAIVEVLTNGVYYRLDEAGVNVDSSDHFAPAGSIIEVGRADLIVMERATGSDASVKVTCFSGGINGVGISRSTAVTVIPTVGGATATLQTTGNAILTTIDVDTGAIAGAIYVEDTGVVGADTGMGVLFGVNTNFSTLAGEGDYGLPAISEAGMVLISSTYDSNVAAGRRTVHLEDVGSAGADAGTVVFIVRDDVLAANAGVNADLDYTWIRADNFGAVWSAMSDTLGLALAKEFNVVPAAAYSGIPAFGVVNVSMGNLATGNNRFGPQAVTKAGMQIVQLVTDNDVVASVRITSFFDSPATDAVGGMVNLIERDDILQANGEVTADLDYMRVKGDNFGSAWSALTADDGARIPATTTAGLLVALNAVDNAVLDAIAASLALVDNPVLVLGTATYAEATTSGNVIGAVRNNDLAALAGTDNELAPVQVNELGAVYVARANRVFESGIIDLVGANDAVMATGTWGDSATFDLNGTDATSGKIEQVCLTMNEEGATGVVISEVGSIVFFDADPTITAADASITVADSKLVIGQVRIVAADWIVSGDNAVQCIEPDNLRFHALTALFMAYSVDGATSFNPNADSDENLDVNVFYTRSY